MSYDELVRSAPIVLGLAASGQAEISRRLIAELVAVGQVAPELQEQALAAVTAREAQGGCTALANGIAIPHCRSELFDEMRVAFGVHPLGIDCGSMDGMPSRIFILVLAPAADPMAHIRFLAEVNRRLLKPEIRENLLLAQTMEEARELLLQPA